MVMMLDWFDAREAVDVGASLADSVLRGMGPARKNTRPEALADCSAETQRLLRRAVLDAPPLKLNLFKRAKLLESFKSRLADQGIDSRRVDELTHLLLLQLSGANAPQPTAAAAAVGRPAASHRERKRIEPLLNAVEEELVAGRSAQAIAQLEEILAIDPDHAVAHVHLGEALSHLGRYGQAEQALRRAVQLDPRRADAHLRLGLLLQWRGDFLGSETTLRRAVKLEPRSANALSALGHTLNSLDRTQDARECFEKALRLNPRAASALCGLGWLTSTEGRFTEAETLLRKALEADPECIEAQVLLASQRKMTRDDAGWLQATNRMLERVRPPIEEAKLRFALGKYHDDLGNHRQAFENYRQANDLRKQVAAPYDTAARTAWVDDVMRVYSSGLVAQPAEAASDSEVPVFVVGMMRSGTSLVEQIIASHPRAAGAGELQFWGMLAHKHPEFLRHHPPDAAFAGKQAEAYLQLLARRGGTATRVVDKTPANVDYLGLIHRLFPKARFICLRRDPVDTCLSCYFQDFSNAAAFSMDLDDLAHYYREHHRLVTHWRSVLPKDVFLEVSYAELVADPERWSRRMLEFIGLEWDPKVLEFDKTERAVLTASSWQVRQKVYASSVGRSRNYQKFIGPLLKLRELA